MKTLQTKILTLVLALGSTVGLSACGTYASNPNLHRVSSNQYLSGGAYVSAASANGCTSEGNIVPDRDVTFDGRDRFTACADASDSAKLKLFGTSSSGNQQLCVFAAQKFENGQIWIKKDTLGIPLVQCGFVHPEQGGSFGFQYTTYNMIFVVPLADKAEMSACLGANTPESCPNFSYGSFR